MSMIGTLLAFVVIPLKARPPEKPAPTPDDEVARLTFALDYWRRAGTALMEENLRLREERVALEREVDHARRGQALSLGQQAGAFEDFCNCVPSRGDVLGNSHGLSG